MQERHYDREKYFNEQSYTTGSFVIPYISKVLPIHSDTIILEIGCGEGGNLKPFLDIGCIVIGIDLAEHKIADAKSFLKEHPNISKLTLIAEDIYNIKPSDIHQADLVIMRDTLEHIYNQDNFLKHLKNFVKPSGVVFLAFPPWRMPFGGHQQVCSSRFLNKLPYFHLLPNPLYIGILKLFGENKTKIQGLLEVKQTRLHIARYQKILKKNDYKIENETFFMINPNYEIKFNLKARPLPKLLNIPFLRDFYTTTYYSIISKMP